MDERWDRTEGARLAAGARAAFAFLADFGYRHAATDISDLGVTVKWLGADRGVELTWERRDEYLDIRVVL